MGARFAPLDFLVALHDLPQNYAQRIVLFDGEGGITAQQYLDKFTDFIDLEEVDDDDVKMRLLAQSFYGKVKKWFRWLKARSIHNYTKLETTFLGRLEDKNNPLQILT